MSRQQQFGERVLAASVARLEAEEYAKTPEGRAALALERLEAVMAQGAPDTLPGGLRRKYPVTVAGAPGWAQVCALDGDLVIVFTDEEVLRRGQRRRLLLVTPGEGGVPRHWLTVPECAWAAFPHDGGKYALAANTLIAARAYENEAR